MDARLADFAADFDPDRPLPGPPEPWESTSAPAARSGPPFAMTEMISVEPALAERILVAHSAADGGAAALAAALRRAGEAREPVNVTGCGTSEHAALAVVELWRDAWRAAGLPGPEPVAAQAFELSLDAPARGLVVGVSHEGATTATNAALSAARSAGAATALLTVTDRSPGAALADTVVATEELDQGWCHVVGYLSPIVAAAAVAGHLTGMAVDASAVRARLAAGIDAALADGAADGIAAAVGDAAQLLVIASGADRPAGRELVLKVEEASYLPSAFRDLETFLHGHLPATGEDTGLVLLLVEPRAREARATRARQALQAARVLGHRAGAILDADASARIPAELTPAGRIVVPSGGGLDGAASALFGSATPLQVLTERIARARGTNPDPIRRDDPRWAAAADAAEA